MRRATMLIILLLMASGLGAKVSPGHLLTGKTLKRGAIAKATSCAGMYHSITDGGHRWNIDGTNNCGRVLACTVQVTLRTNNGLTTRGSCNPAFPKGQTVRLCSAYSATQRWTRISGTWQCR